MTIPKYRPQVGDRIQRPSWRDDVVVVTAVGENHLLARWTRTGNEVTFDLGGDWEPIAPAIEPEPVDPTPYRPSVGDRIKLPFWSRFYEVTAIGRERLLIMANDKEESHKLDLAWERGPLSVSGKVTYVDAQQNIRVKLDSQARIPLESSVTVTVVYP